MKKIIKIIFPESIKKHLRRVENFFDRLTYGFTKPVILDDIFGNKFVLYPEKTPSIRCIINHGYYTKEFMAMDRIVKKGDTAMDVGANVGAVSMYLSRLVSKDGKVISFEPLPETFRRLAEFVQLNNFSNITPIQAAVSQKSGHADFYFYKEMDKSQFNSLGNVHPEDSTFKNKVTVETIAIDDYCKAKSIDRIDFLKIDVEGLELDVLTGAEGMLSTKRIGAIQFEISKSLLKSINRRPEDILDCLKRNQYMIFEFDTESKRFRGPLENIQNDFGNYYASTVDLSLVKYTP